MQFDDFQSLFEYANDAIFLFSLTAEGLPRNYVDVNQVACARLGYSRAELLSLSPLDLTAPEQLIRVPDLMERLRREGSLTFEGSYKSKRGEQVPFEFSARQFILAGHPYVLSIGRDLTDRKETQLALRESEARYRHLVEVSPEMIAVYSEERFLFINEAGAKLLGASHPNEVTGIPVWRFLHPDFHAVTRARTSLSRQEGEKLPPIEEQFIRLDGTPVEVEVQSMSIVYQGQPALLVLARDITERKRAAALIHHMAYFDNLTGLPNQRMFGEQLTNAIQEANLKQHKSALLYIDLDRFKVVSDTLGRQMGDTMLTKAAKRLSRVVGEQGLTAHIGGDEFAVLLYSVKNPGQCMELAQQLVQSIGHNPYNLGGQEVFATCSIGLSVYPDHGSDISALFRSADLAMNRIKASGGNGAQMYDPGMNNVNVLSQRIQLEHHLHQALERQELSLVYQPKVGSERGQIVGVEALVRWYRDPFGFIPPSIFIPVAEETNLIVPIGEFVLRQACQQVAAWREAGLTNLPVAINISPRQFHKVDLVKLLSAILDETKVPAQVVELEITERLLMDDSPHIIRTIHELRQMGVQISIDDFGTGYSSLSYLKRFPVDRLKIDRSFVTDIAVDQSHAGIVAAMINLGHSLNMKVLAEGVETLEQRDYLASRRCDELQGFLFSKPVPATQLTQQLTMNRGLFNVETAR